MYIMIYICIYKSGGNVPAQKKGQLKIKWKIFLKSSKLNSSVIKSAYISHGTSACTVT